MDVVLACDLGGTSLRAALVDVRGETRAEAVVVAPTEIDRLGRSEIDAEEWWTALLVAAARLAESAPNLFARIRGVAICGMTRTQVFLGRGGRQLRPAMTWKDSRAEGAARRLVSGAGRHPETAMLNAFHPVARLAWLREEEEASFRALATVLEPKDYLNFRLTGRKAGDRVSMARLLAAAAPADCGRDLFSAIGLCADVLPAALEPLDQVGVVTTNAPAPFDRIAGAPVFCCSNDTWACVAGLGALRPGYAYNISGTTEVLGVTSEEPAYADGLMTVDWRGVHQLGGPSQNGADTVAWLLGVLGRLDEEHSGIGEAVDRLLAGVPDPQPILFLPYLQGERVPHWDPALRGAFIGLNRKHGAADLALAVLEGVAFLNRLVLEKAEAAIGRPVDEIRFGGGGAQNPIWRQIKADVCGRQVVVGASKEPGLLGAAMVAWTGLGRFASFAEAQEALVKVAARHEPDPSRRSSYDALYSLFLRAETALAPLSHDLAALSRDVGVLSEAI